MVVQFTGILWEYRGEAPWVFITLLAEDAEEVRDRVPERAGFGSVNVNAVISESRWQTSVFPDKGSGSFVLPVKRAVREQEDLAPGDIARVTLHIDVE
ncbi:MAG: DUF1905 domain-containing protein [Acidobacteria bacterium]|nr:DUF1905 domain-containing protein [Acidobacteriota bacterium]